MAMHRYIICFFFCSKVSWTTALRQIVISCYKYHGRDDLLPAFSIEDDKTQVSVNKRYAVDEKWVRIAGALMKIGGGYWKCGLIHINNSTK